MSRLDSQLPPAFGGTAVGCAIISASATHVGSMGIAAAMAVAAVGLGLMAWWLR